MVKNKSITIPTQVILTGSFVRYDRLGELINFAYSGSKANSVNIYIDLYGAIKTLFSDSLRTDISDYTAATSTIINMCGHYRAFFKSIGVSTKIFLVFSYNCWQGARQLVAGYNDQFFKKSGNKMIKEMVELNNSLLELLCPYLPDVHFLKTEYESSVLIDALIKKEKSKGNNFPNIIISKDIYPSQIVCLHDDTTFIKPKKLNNNDVSTIIPPRNHKTFFETFWKIFASLRGIDVDRGSITIHPVNFPLLCSLSRFPERYISGIVSIPRANKIIYSVAGRDPIKIYPTSLGATTLSDGIPISKVESRFRTLDISFASALFADSMESKLIHYENLNDPATINHICAKYFDNNPIDLQRL